MQMSPVWSARLSAAFSAHRLSLPHRYRRVNYHLQRPDFLNFPSRHSLIQSCCLALCRLSRPGPPNGGLAPNRQEPHTDVAVWRCQAAAADAAHLDQPSRHGAAHTARIGAQTSVIHCSNDRISYDTNAVLSCMSTGEVTACPRQTAVD